MSRLTQRPRPAAAGLLLLPVLFLLAAPRHRGGLERIPATAFAAPAGKPTTSELLQALGRELWVISDELLSVSAKIDGGAVLGGSMISLRNSADLMLDGNWEDVMGELETAASSVEWLPYDMYQGVINLFAYYEPLPDWEWGTASYSLLTLSRAVDAQRETLLGRLGGSQREEVDDSLVFVVERLAKTARLFMAGQFYMPPNDPRTKASRGGRAAPRGEPEYTRTYQGGRFSWMKDQYKEEAYIEAEAVGDASMYLLQETIRELEAADLNQRTTVLRKLVRDLHPDRNSDRLAETRPVFDYIRKLRDREK